MSPGRRRGTLRDMAGITGPSKTTGRAARDGGAALELLWAERTHRGLVRTSNQDAVLARPGLFIVADGMGGHEAGDLASTFVVERLGTLLDGRAATRTMVLDAVRDANAGLVALGASRGGSMGTTLCGLVALPTADPGRAKLVVFNVGDSRAYRLRDGSLVQLTRDHSVVQELIDQGAITEAEAEGHPERHVITRSLGADEMLEIDWWLVEPRLGDRFLVASDGLTRSVERSRLEEALIGEADRERAADRLLEDALEAGGRDNISIIVVDVVLRAEPSQEAPIVDPLDDDTEPRPAGASG